QPFFADGPAAITVRCAVQGGVSYFTSAGNYALRHVAQQYYCPGSGGLHDFACGTVLLVDEIDVLPGARPCCASSAGACRLVPRRTTTTWPRWTVSLGHSWT